jgi:N-acetylglucosaminyldiphosphoundecaprenol N-acetyl-beta-D-mannosaminyltransferase
MGFPKFSLPSSPRNNLPTLSLPLPNISSSPGLFRTLVTLLGVPMDALTRPEVLSIAGKWLNDETPHAIVTMGSLMVLDIRKSPQDLAPLFLKASLIVPDSYGLLWASRFLKRPLPDIYPGIELMLDLCRLCAQNNRGVYFLGGQPGVAEKAARRLKDDCPNLNVAGFRDGFFRPEEEIALVEEIRRLKPGALFVGLGQPRQELWIGKYLDRLNVPITMGVGGSFDVYSGSLRRSPAWMSRHGLEWAYRLAQEPFRLPRILRLPGFVAAVVKERLKN